jgi:hypothetical protein
LPHVPSFLTFRRSALLVIGRIVRTVMTLAATVPAVIVTGRIVGTVTSVDATAIITGRVVRSVTTGEPAAIVASWIVCALPSRETALVVRHRTADPDPVLLGERRTGGLQGRTAGAGPEHQSGDQ